MYELVRYSSCNLITPVVNDILSEDIAGTTCVLTKTNEEALQITGLLLKNGMQAKRNLTIHYNGNYLDFAIAMVLGNFYNKVPVQTKNKLDKFFMDYNCEMGKSIGEIEEETIKKIIKEFNNIIATI